jgi:hypothetical protein
MLTQYVSFDVSTFKNKMLKTVLEFVVDIKSLSVFIKMLFQPVLLLSCVYCDTIFFLDDQGHIWYFPYGTPYHEQGICPHCDAMDLEDLARRSRSQGG